MIELGQQLRRCRLASGMTQGDLANAIGCSTAQVSLMERGRRRISLDHARRLEGALDATPGSIIESVQLLDVPPLLRQRLHHSTGARIPIINKIAAGPPVAFTDLDYPIAMADDYCSCPDLNDENAFACRVWGDSMSPDYRTQEIVIFSPARSVHDGDDCFVRLHRDDEMTFKRVHLLHDQHAVRLEPLNPTHETRVVTEDAIAAMYPAAFVIRAVNVT